MKEHLLLDLLHTSKIIEHRLDKLLKRFGLTLGQYSILGTLTNSNSASLSIGEIKAKMFSSSSDLTRLIDRLESKKVVKRRNCENNRRITYVNITKKGLDLMILINEELNSLLEDVFEFKLKNSEIDVINNLFNNIIKADNRYEVN